MADYDFKTIEGKWQERWLKENLFAAPASQPSKKIYVLDMFPYPSGDGLHVGHVKIYTAADVVARYLRMKGLAVLHPTGWDAFGLPTENTAIKLRIHPADLTKRNIERFRRQMQRLGWSYDWDREINTTDPEYYKWTQWIFLKLFKMGLVYQDTFPINWCPQDKTGLANEEVVDGKCDRCGTPVEKRPMRQWLMRITKYADRLLEGLTGLDWPQFILELQRNWIGRSEGINITYQIKDSDEKVICFTTRPDTNFGATFVVIAPEHPLAQKVAKDNNAVAEYIAEVLQTTETERMAEGRKKTGVFTGLTAINDLNQQAMPVWVSDFVIGHFGTGAVVGVPGHDQRDFEFAQAMGLPITRVVVGPDGDTSPIEQVEQVQEEQGTMIDSGFLNGLNIQEAIGRMKKYLQEKGYGQHAVRYKLRDWVFSRQRYWGEPIPIIHCQHCGVVPVPVKDLPVLLPVVENYQPTGTGESPLAAIESWVNVKCPTCPRMARRETNTMPQWAGSSWYWLRYLSPQYTEALVDPAQLVTWMPVDLYIGGAEHAVLHLLYARFWTKALFDAGVVFQDEPFKRFRAVGLVLGEDGQKMSKSRGNVINPDTVVEQYGADTLRIYEMFMGPFENAAPWDTHSIAGAHRFLKRVWNFVQQQAATATPSPAPEEELAIQQTIKRVSESIENFKFNTAISALMELLNTLEKSSGVARATLERYVLMLAPLAPHIAEELWATLGRTRSLMYEPWPQLNTKILESAVKQIPVQVNGRMRGILTISPDTDQVSVEAQAKAVPNVAKYLSAGQVSKVIYVPNKSINFVVK